MLTGVSDVLPASYLQRADLSESWITDVGFQVEVRCEVLNILG